MDLNTNAIAAERVYGTALEGDMSLMTKTPKIQSSRLLGSRHGRVQLVAIPRSQVEQQLTEMESLLTPYRERFGELPE